jgi:hypothetical protein
LRLNRKIKASNLACYPTVEHRFTLLMSDAAGTMTLKWDPLLGLCRCT